MNTQTIKKLLEKAIAEDLGEEGDITSQAVLDKEEVLFTINAREDLVLCGIPVVSQLFSMFPDKIKFEPLKKDGDFIKAGETIIKGEAEALTIFAYERIALNFMQHLSGISSFTNQFVREVQGTQAIIRDTRKTTSGLRLMEKYAVAIGGGQSYRLSLSDKILIKDNHIAGCGSIKKAISRVKTKMPTSYIAIECDSIEQVKEVLEHEPDLIMLDNMTVSEVSQAVSLVAGKAKLEASGGITLSNVKNMALTGVDYIAVGAITHSAPNKDIGLDIENKNLF